MRLMGWFRRAKKPLLTNEEVADIIDAFIDGTGGPWDWDDFTSLRINDPVLDAVRLEAAQIPYHYPPTRVGTYSSEEGREELRLMAERLRARK